MPSLRVLALGCLALVNLAAFLTFGADKRRAKRGEWRIPERTLFLLALAFGGAGALAGMHFFHHKTKHWYFRLGVPLILLAQLGSLLFLRQRGYLAFLVP